MSRPASLLVLLPSLRISGGVAEALKLARELAATGVTVQILSFWKAQHELDTADLSVSYLLDSPPQRGRAPFQLPLLALRFIRFTHRWRRGQPGKVAFLLTHFTTFFFAWLQPGVHRVCFIQDREWLMVQGWKRSLLKKVILFTSRRSTVVTANSYISTHFQELGVLVFAKASIWADSKWLSDEVSTSRPIDVSMLLRTSPFKRLDLHLSLLKLLSADTNLRIVIVTPDDAIAPLVAHLPCKLLLRPSDAVLKELFAETRLFILLSDVEGFALPPLEAMGSGAIPLCRDSGGVRNYLHDLFNPLLIPQSESIEQIRDRVLSLLASPHSLTPDDARTAFANGLLQSRETRADAIRSLSSLLQTQSDSLTRSP